MKKIAVFLMLFTIVLYAQVKVTKIEVLDLGTSAIMPVFSEDGDHLVFSSMEGGSVYDLKDGKTTRFSASANDYSMDAEGKIRYRVDSYVDGLRMNSVMLYDTKLNETTTLLDKKRLDIIPNITDHRT